MSANGISTLSTKEAKQKAKLDLAASNRASDGNPRAEYDITQLPTQYYGNGIEDNPNTGGLVRGRPWVTGTSAKYQPGLYASVYSGYFDDVSVNWFATQTPATSGADSTLAVSTPAVLSAQYLGYFVARTTETYTFYTNSDDASYLWIGPNAVSGFTTANATVNNGGAHGPQERSGTIDLVAGRYYPIRIQYGNAIASGVLTVSFSTPTITKTSTFDDFIFYNEDTNGL